MEPPNQNKNSKEPRWLAIAATLMLLATALVVAIGIFTLGPFFLLIALAAPAGLIVALRFSILALIGESRTYRAETGSPRHESRDWLTVALALLPILLTVGTLVFYLAPVWRGR